MAMESKKVKAADVCGGEVASNVTVRHLERVSS